MSNLIPNDPITQVKGLDLNLDGIDTILIHPNNYERIVKLFKNYSDEVSSFIHMPKAIKINTDINLPEYSEKQAVDKDGNKLWKRTNKLAHKFVTWTEDHELKNPTSWQIYFGFVEPEYEPYIVGVRMGATWSWNTKPLSETRERRKSLGKQYRYLQWLS